MAEVVLELVFQALKDGLTESFVNYPDIDPTSVGITCRGNRALHIAAQQRTSDRTFQEIINSDESLLLATNMKGDTPLHIAARFGNIETTEQLIRASGTKTAEFVRIRNMKNSTALHEAVRSGHFKVAEILMDKITSDLSDFEYKEGESLLFMALDGGHFRIAHHILKLFPNCSVFGSHGLTAMHTAVLRPDPKMFLKRLLEVRGPEILEISDDIGWMPHHYAAATGNSLILNHFLETTRNLAYILDNEGMSALHISARNGKLSVVRSLVRTIPDICELLDKKGQTALHTAALHEQAGVISLFLRTTAFTDLINEQDKDGNTALHLAATTEHCKCIILLATDRRVNMRLLNNMGMTAYDIIQKSSMRLGPFEKVLVKFNIAHRHSPLSSLQEFATTVAQPVKKARAPNKTQTSDLKASQNDKDQMADIILLVATIIAGITFTAAITMPGGFNNSNGLAVLRDVSHFKKFLVFNALAFGCAAGTMLIHFAALIYLKLRGKAYKYPIEWTMLLTALSITSTVLAFVMATNAVLYDQKSHKNVWPFSLPGNIAFFTFIATFLYFFVPLILIALYYTVLQVPEEVRKDFRSLKAFAKHNMFPRFRTRN